MTAGDMLLMMVKTRSELANRWCVITVEQAEALADLVEACEAAVHELSWYASRRANLGKPVTGGSGTLWADSLDDDITPVRTALAAVERAFTGDEHAKSE